MDISFKELEAEISKIEKKSAPLRKKLQEASLELEKHRNVYLKAKAKLLPQIQEIEGEQDHNGQSVLQRLMRQRNAMIRNGAGRE